MSLKGRSKSNKMQQRNVCAYIDPRTRTDHLTLSQLSAALMPAIHHRPPSYRCAGRRRLSAFENRLEADICHGAHVIWSRTPICGIYERQQNLIGVQFTLRVCCPLLLYAWTSGLPKCSVRLWKRARRQRPAVLCLQESWSRLSGSYDNTV